MRNYWILRTALNGETFFASDNAFCPYIIRVFKDRYLIYDTRKYSYYLKMRLHDYGNFYGYSVVCKSLKTLNYTKARIAKIMKGDK